MNVSDTNIKESWWDLLTSDKVYSYFRFTWYAIFVYIFIFFFFYFSIRGVGNLRICVDHPLNSSIGIIIHQECVKSVRYQDSLEGVTLENNNNAGTLRILILWTRPIHFLIDVFLSRMQQVKLLQYVILHDSYVQSSLLGW